MKKQTFNTEYSTPNSDGFVKSPLGPLIVIPAKAGIQSFHAIMDSRLRRNDAIFDFLRLRQFCFVSFSLIQRSMFILLVSNTLIQAPGVMGFAPPMRWFQSLSLVGWVER
jgi:hypothetical protein